MCHRQPIRARWMSRAACRPHCWRHGSAYVLHPISLQMCIPLQLCAILRSVNHTALLLEVNHSPESIDQSASEALHALPAARSEAVLPATVLMCEHMSSVIHGTADPVHGNHSSVIELTVTVDAKCWPCVSHNDTNCSIWFRTGTRSRVSAATRKKKKKTHSWR